MADGVRQADRLSPCFGKLDKPIGESHMRQRLQIERERYLLDLDVVEAATPQVVGKLARLIRSEQAAEFVIANITSISYPTVAVV
jgi:hypothetical protein